LLVWRWFRRHDRSSIDQALAAVSMESIHDVLVPDGMGGEIHIEHLLLTAHGVLVVNVKRYEGVIFASDLMDQWTAIGEGGRSTFANPLSDLYDRVAAVRLLLLDMPVEGFVLFPSDADFSKGRPNHVLLPDDLTERYAKPAADEVARLSETLAPQWEQIREAVKPA
jgi:hypothetical protein